MPSYDMHSSVTNEDGYTWNYSTSSSYPESTSEVIASGVTPNFEKLKSSGALVPYTVRHVKSSSWRVYPSQPYVITAVPKDPGGYYQQLVKSVQHYLSVKNLPAFGFAAGDGYHDRLFQKSYNACYRGAFMLAVEMFESRKVLDLVKSFKSNLLVRINKVWAYIRRRYKSSGRKAADSFASAWMEYRYGWRNLVFSMKALSNAILEWFARTDLEIVSRTSRAIATGEYYNNSSFSGAWAIGTKPLQDIPIVVSMTPSVITEVRATYAAMVSKLGRMVDLNPLTFLHEITPFSWVADWFVTIGDFVGAIANVIIHGKGGVGCVSEKHAGSVVVEGYPAIPQNLEDRNYTYTVSGGGGSYAIYRTSEYIRTPRQAGLFSTPTLEWSLNLDFQKVLDAISLIILKGPRARFR